MAVTITIPTALRQYTSGKSSVDLDADTVQALLHALTSQHPDLSKHLYTDDGALRSFVNIYVGDEDIRFLEGEATPLRSGETVSIIPAIAGGRCAAAGEEPR